jgi:LmbE family N-acetylglucosaminyl deacetylase
MSRNALGDYHRVYLSPHLDDAIFSCGGAIAAATEEGARVLVVTVCTAAASGRGSAFARQVHQAWGLDGARVREVRLAEDDRALATVGADGLRLEFLDAIYRCPDLYDDDRRLFGELAAADPLPASLPGTVKALAARWPAARFFLPLAVGGHVDHRITQATAGALGGMELAFYEDLPYAFEPGAVAARLDQLGLSLSPEEVEVTRTFPRKLAAVEAYASQLPSLFGSVPEMRARMARQAAVPGSEIMVERLWRWGKSGPSPK